VVIKVAATRADGIVGTRKVDYDPQLLHQTHHVHDDPTLCDLAARKPSMVNL
jgi:hypothetical protein